MSIFLGVYKLNMVKRCRCYQLYALCCLISGYLQTSWSHFPTLQIGLLCRALHWNCKPQLTVLLNIRQDAQNWFAERGLITSTVLTCSRLITEHVWLCLVIGTLPHLHSWRDPAAQMVTLLEIKLLLCMYSAVHMEAALCSISAGLNLFWMLINIDLHCW